MTSQDISQSTNVQDCHEIETAQQTIEPSYDIAQLRRQSQRVLAALAASLPIFERSPAPSPPPSEERNVFLKEQKIEEKTTVPRNRQINKAQLR